MAETHAPASRNPVSRPLSPHLQIYEWSWTMAMSIAHRVTGSALYIGTVLLAVWLVALAAGPGPYEGVRWFLGSWIGRLVLFGYTWALLHHMLGGLRHFVWDTGHGYDAATRMNLARGTLVVSAALTVVVWIVGYMVR